MLVCEEWIERRANPPDEAGGYKIEKNWILHDIHGPLFFYTFQKCPNVGFCLCKLNRFVGQAILVGFSVTCL